MAGGLGCVIAATFAERLARRFGVGPLIVYGLLLTAFGWQAFGMIRGSTVVATAALGVGMLLFDFGAVLWGISYLSLRQAITPDRLLGRMTATMRFLAIAAAPLGSLVGGALATQIGLRETLWGRRRARADPKRRGDALVAGAQASAIARRGGDADSAELAAAPCLRASPVQLERIDGRQPQQRRQLVERAARFVEQRRIAQVGGRQPVAIMAADPAVERGIEGGVEEDVRRHRAPVVFRHRHAQPQARRTAAVAHALLQIERHTSAIGEAPATSGRAGATSSDGAALRRRDEQEATVGQRQQLAVEQVRADGVGQRQFVVADHERREAVADRRRAARRAPPADRRTRARGRTGTCARRRRSRRCGRRRRRCSRDAAARTPSGRIETVPARDGFARLRASAAPDSAPAPCRRRSRAARRRRARRRAASSPAAKRVWLAAPSSPSCGAAGSGSCTRKRVLSAKMARSTRVVVGASSARWRFVSRFAGVKCRRPSAQSAAALTVAAFAAHIDAADEHAASRSGASRPAATITS